MYTYVGLCELLIRTKFKIGTTRKKVNIFVKGRLDIRYEIDNN